MVMLPSDPGHTVALPRLILGRPAEIELCGTYSIPVMSAFFELADLDQRHTPNGQLRLEGETLFLS